MKTSISDDEKAIIEESRHWVLKNKGVKCEQTGYSSPRISSELMDCSMPMTFDQYNYCSLGCLYCFAYAFKSMNAAMKNISLKAVNADSIIRMIENKPKTVREKAMVKHFFNRQFLLHWGGLADPFCPFEKANATGYKLLEALAEYDYPTLFSFKGDVIFNKKYREFFEKWADQQNFAFQVSIITASDELSKLVEIGVPTTTKRLEATKMLSDMGYYTILRLRPFVIGVTDNELDELLERSLEAGIQGVSMEFFAVESRATEGLRQRLDWIGRQMGLKGYKDLRRYFKLLSPRSRGGYLRLNRLVKEEYVKKVYKFCVKHGLTYGCSDPDFKELCTSGSCCGMPDDFPGNRKLENWSRDQLTYHIKECRRAYHRTGELKELHFTEVYSAEADWLDDFEFIGDHIATSGLQEGARRNARLRTLIRVRWNNLRSPSNPRNYFDNKLVPTGVDSAGDLVFRYNPMEYEERWLKEGIDLKA